MFGSQHHDGTAARARLQAVLPRWVPAEEDLVPRRSESPPANPEVDAVNGRVAKHALPAAPTTWRLDGGTVRGLVSLALAAVAGALVVVIVGWPRGSVAPDQTTQLAADASAEEDSVLVQPSDPAAATVTEVVVVDVDGAVRRPGVVELPAGSRVVDALKSAGGVSAKADTGALNLAQVLIDGEQIVVPKKGADPTGIPGSPTVPDPGGTAPASVVNLNTATPVELETLPGIGPVLAAAIVDWRTQNGGFTSVDQLEQVSGIGPATFADIAPLVRL
ncbi:MAG: helix-hairpin-helix domain-containing protein [Actinomycetes bacterium]